MKQSSKERAIIILTVVPSIAGVAIFVYGFIGWTVVVSLSNWNGILPDYSFAGIRNFVEVFKNARFIIDIFNNAFFSILFIPQKTHYYLCTLLD